MNRRTALSLLLAGAALTAAAAPRASYANTRRGGGNSARKPQNGEAPLGRTTDIKRTGVKSADNFFASVKEIDDRLDRAERARRDGRNALAVGLGLKNGTPLKDSVREVKAQLAGKVQLGVQADQPSLAPRDNLPPTARSAVDAVNTFFTSYVGAVRDLAGTPKHAAEVVAKSRGLPQRFKAELQAMGPIGWIQHLDDIRTLKDNLRITAELPKRTKVVMDGLNGDLKLMVTAFGGQWPPRLLDR